MSHRKDVSVLLKQVRAEGGIVTKTHGGHWKIYNPATGKCIRIPSTPSDQRFAFNARARLRKIGLLVRTARSESQELDLCH